MPWKENSVMDERISFIKDYNSGLFAMTELCERYEVSRKTGYKWVERYRDFGAAGLMDRPRAPHDHGRATAQNIAEAIIGMRQLRPSWGPRKIVAKLTMDHPAAGWPAASTAGEILKRAGLVSRRRIRRSAPPRLGALTVPHDSTELREELQERGIKPVIPNRSCRKQPFSFNTSLY